MTPQDKAAAWIKESGRTQAIIDCKKAIEKLDAHMDKYGFTPADLIDCKKAIEKLDAHMDKYGFTPADLQAQREYKEILKIMQHGV